MPYSSTISAADMKIKGAAHKGASEGRPQEAIVGGFLGDFGDAMKSEVGTAVLKELSGATITPEFKEHLRTLANIDTLGKEPTEAERDAAIEAYNAIGRKINIAVAKAVMHHGIRTAAKAWEYSAPFADAIAGIAAEPLAKMMVDASETSSGFQQKLVNAVLGKMGKGSINFSDSKSKKDFGMARFIGKFAGGILQTIEGKERTNKTAGSDTPQSLIDSRPVFDLGEPSVNAHADKLSPPQSASERIAQGRAAVNFGIV